MFGDAPGSCRAVACAVERDGGTVRIRRSLVPADRLQDAVLEAGWKLTMFRYGASVPFISFDASCCSNQITCCSFLVSVLLK